MSIPYLRHSCMLYHHTVRFGAVREAALQGETPVTRAVAPARLSEHLRGKAVVWATMRRPRSQPPGESKGGLFAADGTLMSASPSRTTSSPTLHVHARRVRCRSGISSTTST